MIAEVIVLVVLIFFSAVFSAVEIAIFSLSKLRIEHLVNKNVPSAKILQKLRNNPDRLLSTILVGNNFVNVAASVLGTKLAFDIFRNFGLSTESSLVLGITTGIMTMILLLIGEVIPKTLASYHNERFALASAYPINLLSKIFYPVITCCEFITDRVLGIVGKPKWKPTVTKEEILSIVDVGEEEGEIKKNERELIGNVLKLEKLSVKEIVVPRGDMLLLDGNKTLQEIWPSIIETKHSRYPVFENRRDNILGIFLLKEACSKILEAPATKVKDLVKQIIVIPETKPLDSLLSEFQKKKMHLAIVVDEHGGIVGLVTLEDVLERIVGPIYDEVDKIVKTIDKVSQHIYMIKGKTSIDEINKKLRLKLKVNKNIETIGGFVLDKLGRIPHVGERLTFSRYEIIIEKVEGNRIVEVSIIKK